MVPATEPMAHFLGTSTPATVLLAGAAAPCAGPALARHTERNNRNRLSTTRYKNGFL